MYQKDKEKTKNLKTNNTNKTTMTVSHLKTMIIFKISPNIPNQCLYFPDYLVNFDIFEPNKVALCRLVYMSLIFLQFLY